MGKIAIHKYWDKMNEAMVAISEATRVAVANEEVIEHLKDYGCFDENKDPVFWVVDYISKMFEE